MVRGKVQLLRSQLCNIFLWCLHVWILCTPRRILRWVTFHANFQMEFPKYRELHFIIHCYCVNELEKYLHSSAQCSRLVKAFVINLRSFSQLDAPLKTSLKIDMLPTTLNSDKKLSIELLCAQLFRIIWINRLNSSKAILRQHEIIRLSDELADQSKAVFLFSQLFSLGELWKCALVKLFKNTKKWFR